MYIKIVESYCANCSVSDGATFLICVLISRLSHTVVITVCKRR